MPTVLVTANVVINALSRNDEAWRYYTDWLRRLSSQSLNLYITDIDYELSFGFWERYQLGGTLACQEAFAQLQGLVRRCPVDPWIVDDSRSYPMINFYDAIRIACAIDRCVDAIITWEPSHFATNNRDLQSARQHGYFYRTLRTQMLDDEIDRPTIGVFNLSAFLSLLDDSEPIDIPERELEESFQLVDFRIEGNNDFNGGINNYRVRTVVRCPQSRLVPGEGVGTTPCGALFNAIDQCVDHCIDLPRRIMIYFFAPERIGGADSLVEVVIRVECNGSVFEESAAHSNVILAFGNAYIQAINDICKSLTVG